MLFWMLDRCRPFVVSYFIVVAAIILICTRLLLCSPRIMKRRKKDKRAGLDRIRLMIFFGSGGHTTEMLRMIPLLDVNRYDIHVVLSHSDNTSAAKIESTESIPAMPRVGNRWHRIFRSREVKQSWLSTVPTTVVSLLHAFWLVASIKPEVILCNGPGTCVGLCYTAYALRVLGVYDNYVIFVESFCRVQTLSLTGKLLYPIADRFIVQWRELSKKYKDAEYLGVIC